MRQAARPFQKRIAGSRSYRVLESSRAERVQNFPPSHSRSTGNADAESKVVQIRSRMSVRRNNKLNVALACLPCPPRLHVQPVWISADLDCGARFGDHIQYFFDTARNRRSSLNQPP